MAKIEKKIFLERGDELQKAIEFLVNNLAEKVILNIPRNSVLGGRLNNFQILKKESVTADKELIIESVDEHILELAGLAGIEAINPFFRTREKVVTDVLPKKFSPVIPPVAKQTVKETKKEVLVESFFEASKIKEKKQIVRRSSSRMIFRLAVTVVVIILGGFGLFRVAANVLPRADIILTLKKIPADLNEEVIISSTAAVPDVTNGKIVLPGELLVAKLNIDMSFSASGQEKVEEKARGVLTVYNAYGTAPQTLIKSTRFESPDKKIFRLDKQVTIPGATVSNGKIVPSRIEVEVTADAPGEAYNAEPSSLWRIPGFKDSPKYEGFYAEAVKPLSGGFIGEKGKPSKDDLNNARAKIAEALRSALKSQMLILLKDKFKLLDGATQFQITKEEVKTDSGDGKFSVFAEGEMRQLVFEEEMLKRVLSEKTKTTLASNLPQLKISDFDLSYGSSTPDLANGKMTTSLSGSIVYLADIDVKKLAEDTLGRNEENLKAMIFSLPGLEKAKISLWPFWVKEVPSNVGRVKLTVE